MLQYLSRGELADWLPAELVAQFRMTSLPAALRYVHRPPPDASLELLASGAHPAQQRLAFEELLAHHLSLKRLRERTAHMAAPVLQDSNGLVARFIRQLPFTLTGAQQRVIDEITADLHPGWPHPCSSPPTD